MAENHGIKPPLKILERIGKEYITGFLEDIVQKNVLKLDEEAKRKFMEAERRDKARVFVDSIRQKPQEAGQAFLQAFFNLDKHTSNAKGCTTSNILLQQPLLVDKRCSEQQDTHASLVTIGAASSAVFSFAFAPVTLQVHCCASNLRRLDKNPSVYKSKVVQQLGIRIEEDTQIDFRNRRSHKKIYPIKDRNERTRQALILCNIEFDHLCIREGAEQDITGMEKLLGDLDYTVTVKKNLTARDMESELREFAAKPEHKSSDSTFLVLMSHGILHGICGTLHSDKTPDVLQYDTIFNIFNNRACSGLRDKPKVIIVQACRGGDPGDVWVRDSPAALEHSRAHSPETLESDAVYMTHVEKDFIIFYSTTPHTKSWRNATNGSYFITQLIAGFQKYAWCDPLQEIFRKVQLACEKPNDIAQMPTIGRSTVGRLFYLFPGH
ncbi:caspase-13 [Octodon degus]|uniref:Caspase-13 n=1 Tax=Octodon degus TaxID=10160 RepID=A0A6P6DZA0_OCTDE|nr:caspase-13 [Octodon degus]